MTRNDDMDKRNNPHSLEHRYRISLANSGKKRTPEMVERMRTIGKNSNARFWKGKKLSPEHRKKLSEAHKGIKLPKERRIAQSERQKGENSHLWRGGLTDLNTKIRNGVEYKLWREAVFERDNYTCVWCGARSGNGKTVVLNADHIKPFAHFPELRFAIDNGRTLCVSCHRTTNTFAGRSKK